MRKAEGVVLAGVILLFVGLAGALWMLRATSRTNEQMREDAAQFRRAIRAYELRYGKLPTPYNGYVDVAYGDSPRFPNRYILQVLMAREGLGNRSHQLNPDRISFLAVRAVQRGASGLRDDLEWLDPWGTPYRVVLDTDANKVCNLDESIHHATPAVGHRAVLWSAGPDRLANTADDVLTWRLLFGQQLEEES
jgi:type II secretory pathway pseudopilin PulG